MRHAEDHAYRLGLGLATLLMAIQLTEREADEQRHERKQSVLHEKWAVLRDTFREELRELQGYGGTGPSVRQLVDAFANATASWEADRRRTLLIDVLMGDPFAPYELKVAVEDADEAIRTIAEPLGLDDGETAQLWDVWTDALNAYRPSRWKRPAAKVKSIPALTTGEFVLPPPPVDTSDDAAPADALSSDHHLALLGGGSLAASDSEMAGGLWLVHGNGQHAGDQLADGARTLLGLEVPQARVELVKLQMSYALVVAPGHAAATDESAVVEALDEARDDVARQLDAERERNDDEAQRIRTLEEILDAVDMARGYIDEADRSPAREAAAPSLAPTPAEGTT